MGGLEHPISTKLAVFRGYTRQCMHHACYAHLGPLHSPEKRKRPEFECWVETWGVHTAKSNFEIHIKRQSGLKADLVKL